MPRSYFGVQASSKHESFPAYSWGSSVTGAVSAVRHHLMLTYLICARGGAFVSVSP